MAGGEGNRESRAVRPDVIGRWSQLKLQLLEKYATAYSTIMASQHWSYHYYIDAFAGLGYHLSKESSERVEGSPIRALKIKPPFKEYYFIDIEGEKIDYLRQVTRGRKNVNLRVGDCNSILINEIFPRVARKKGGRALCFLDPYGMHVHWDVLEAAGKTGRVDLFFNFSLFDTNFNVVRDHPSELEAREIARFNRCFGSHDWYTLLYDKSPSLFDNDHEHRVAKAADVLVPAFRERLKTVAGFAHVADPMPFKNSEGGILYFLFFASPAKVAPNIWSDIFGRDRDPMYN
jgi:three-Cys-motif partner protein